MTSFPNQDGLVIRVERSRSLKRRYARWTVVLIVSVVACFISLVAGMAIGAAVSFKFIGGHSLAAVMGTILLIASLALMMMSAHCMDKIDLSRRALRQLEQGIEGRREAAIRR